MKKTPIIHKCVRTRIRNVRFEFYYKKYTSVAYLVPRLTDVITSFLKSTNKQISLESVLESLEQFPNFFIDLSLLQTLMTNIVKKTKDLLLSNRGSPDSEKDELVEELSETLSCLSSLGKEAAECSHELFEGLRKIVVFCPNQDLYEFLAALLHKTGPVVEVSVLSNEPNSSSALKGFKHTYKTKFDLPKEICRADCVLFGTSLVDTFGACVSDDEQNQKLCKTALKFCEVFGVKSIVLFSNCQVVNSLASLNTLEKTFDFYLSNVGIFTAFSLPLIERV